MLVIPRRCGSFGSSLLLGAMLVSVAPHSVLAQAKESKPPLVTTLPAVVTKPTDVKKNSKPVVVKPTKDVKKDVKVPIVALPKRIPLPPIQKLVPTPPKIALNGPYGETRLLVEGLPAKGVGRDVSSDAEFTLADSKIAEVDGVGIVHALRDGKTVLTARYQGRTVSVPVMVTGVAKAPAPSFVKEVMPILTKTGCNMGACHGAGAGKHAGAGRDAGASVEAGIGSAGVGQCAARHGISGVAGVADALGHGTAMGIGAAQHLATLGLAGFPVAGIAGIADAGGDAVL